MQCWVFREWNIMFRCECQRLTTYHKWHFLYAHIYRASARPPASQSTAPHFPSSLDGMRNQKARTGLVRQSAVIELHPLNWTWPHFGMQSLSQSEAFLPLSLQRSDVDNERDVTLHIKATASARSWHFVLGLGSEHLLGS